MRPNRLFTCVLLSLVIAVAVATPLTRQNVRQQRHFARQLTATTAMPVQAKTGYPLAGFRPSIPFDLPNERNPKELPDVTSTPVPAADDTLVDAAADSGGVNVDIEVIVENGDEDYTEENVGEQAQQTPKEVVQGAVEVEVGMKEESSDAELEAHTPAIEYGPPVDDDDINSEELLVDHFQPPNREAEEFTTRTPATETNVDASSDAATSSSNAGAPAQPVADFPTSETSATPAAASASEVSNMSAAPIDVSFELDGEAAERHVPAVTYGPPLPADVYGAPGRDTVVPPEVEEEDFGVELNELEPMAAVEDDDLAAEQIDLLSGFSELHSGRLIFVPSDGSNVRQIFFAAPPQQRRINKSGRLIRL